METGEQGWTDDRGGGGPLRKYVRGPASKDDNRERDDGGLGGKRARESGRKRNSLVKTAAPRIGMIFLLELSSG